MPGCRACTGHDCGARAPDMSVPSRGLLRHRHRGLAYPTRIAAPPGRAKELPLLHCLHVEPLSLLVRNQEPLVIENLAQASLVTPIRCRWVRRLPPQICDRQSHRGVIRHHFLLEGLAESGRDLPFRSHACRYGSGLALMERARPPRRAAAARSHSRESPPRIPRPRCPSAP